MGDLCGHREVFCVLLTSSPLPQLSQAGDLIMEVYLEQQLPDNCVTLKVSPTLTAEELTNQVLEMRGTAAGTDLWVTFEILEHGELGEYDLLHACASMCAQGSCG